MPLENQPKDESISPSLLYHHIKYYPKYFIHLRSREVKLNSIQFTPDDDTCTCTSFYPGHEYDGYK